MRSTLLLLSTLVLPLFSSCAAGTFGSSGADYDNILSGFLDSTRAADTQDPAGIPRAQPSGALADVNAGERISPGDSVAISVWGYPEFSTRTIVKTSGTIVVPLLGELSIGGMTNEQLVALLRQRLSEFIQGEIRLTVEVIPPLPRIVVIGAVSRPGSYPLSKGTPLLDALSLAGGWTATADLKRIQLIRAKDSRKPDIVDLYTSLDKGGPSSLPSVLPGDAIVVPEKEDFLVQAGAFFTAVLGILFLLGITTGFQ